VDVSYVDPAVKNAIANINAPQQVGESICRTARMNSIEDWITELLQLQGFVGHDTIDC
jgi:hypothetical protein